MSDNENKETTSRDEEAYLKTLQSLEKSMEKQQMSPGQLLMGYLSHGIAVTCVGAVKWGAISYVVCMVVNHFFKIV